MIIYVGNILSRRGGSVGFIETLAPRLADRYHLKYVSSVRNKGLRLLHMVGTILVNAHRTRIVLVDTFSTQAFWFAYTVSRVCSLLRIPYITVLRGGDFPARLVSSPYHSNMLLSNSRRNISPSRYLLEQLKGRGRHADYIPNFIDLPQYSFKNRRQVKPRLLWVRAFHQIYNPSMAVRVLHQIIKKYPDAQLCMVGADTDGSLMEVKEAINDLGLGNNVRITGRLVKKEWIALSQEYDIFINTTRIDNMPVSVIEAMALGLPVISTRVGGIPFLLEHEKTALLVDNESVMQMADSVVQLVEDPGLASSLSLSARAAAEKFDWMEVKQQWFDVLDNFEQPAEMR